MNTAIEPVLAAFTDYREFVVLGHDDPDADCLGSQRALGSWLSRRGKVVHLCSAGPWRRPEVAEWQPLFQSHIPKIESTDQLLLVILDCSSPERTGFKESDIPAASTLVIDHHSAGSDYGDIRYVNPFSPSTTLLVQEIIEAAGDRPNREEAEMLFLGFCTDTGFFRHVEPWQQAPLEAVARLVGAGASPPATFRRLTGGRSLDSCKLLGRVLERAERFFGGRLIVSWETWKDWRELGNKKDSDMLFQLLLGITGIEAAAVVREQNDGRCVVALRSLTDLDVSAIARFFGGGGHKKAAGCVMSGDRHDVMDNLLQLFADRLKDLNAPGGPSYSLDHGDKKQKTAF